MKAKYNTSVKMTISAKEAREIAFGIHALMEELDDESHFLEGEYPALGELLEHMENTNE